MAELMTCPFCGKKPKFKVVTNGIRNDARTIGFQIGCGSCGVFLPNIYEVEVTMNEQGEIKFMHDEREKALKQWNTRTGCKE